MPAPYSDSTDITDFQINWATHRREAPGADNWAITWLADGEQFTTFGDGDGFNGNDSGNGRASLGFTKISGDKDTYTGQNIYGGYQGSVASTIDGKSYGVISIAGVLYAWVSPGSGSSGYNEQRLYTSTDEGLTWTQANWNVTGIVHPTFIQFGQDYAGGGAYVYCYAINIKQSGSLQVQTPGELVLMRCPVGEIMTEASWQYAQDTTGTNWGAFATRAVIFANPEGVGWNVSGIYNAGLQKYIIMTEHLATVQSNLGIFESDNPWGPWSTVYYGTLGPAPGNEDDQIFFYNFSNKWTSTDGLNSVLIYSGININDAWNTVETTFTATVPAPAPGGTVAFRASNELPALGLAKAKSLALDLKQYLESRRTQFQSATNADAVVDVYFKCAAFLNEIAAIKAEPGDIVQYARDQENDQNYDVIAEFNGLETAVTTLADTIHTAFPKDGNDYLLEKKLNNITRQYELRQFSSAQLSALITDMDAVINAIV